MPNYPTDDGFEVEWDEDKNRSNQRKHSVSFQEAATVFADPFSLAAPDHDHSVDEPRYHIIGESVFGELLVVTYAERNGKIRIISAREPTRQERRAYEEGS